MAQLFRPLVFGVVFTSLICVAPGCRTTTSRLASVPGFGWMDRDEEGWAGYEPAPSLPRPSATSEPSTAGESTSHLAGNSTTTPSATSAYNRAGAALAGGGYPKDVGGLNSGYPSKGTTGNEINRNAASGYGDYASAYGKYGPPKSLSKRDDTTKPQQGPYSVASTPNYASPGESSKGFGALSQDGIASESNSLSPSLPQNLDARPSDRFSRFEATASSGLADSKASTYTPPGFITKPSAEPTTSRFGPPADRSSTLSSTTNRATEYVATTQDQTSNSSWGGSTAAPADRFSTPTNGDRFGSPLQGSFVPSGSGSRLDTATSAPRNGPHRESDRFLGSDPRGVTRNAAEAAVGVAGATANGYLDSIRKNATTSPATSNSLSGAEGGNVTPSGGYRYPSTDTPHGYLDSITPPSGRQDVGTPSTSAPTTIQRSTTPFRPGSTSTFRSSMRTSKKQEISLASSQTRPDDNQLVLAVGDKFQFPRTLR